MGEKIVVGPLTRGLRNDVTPFVIDNESFPKLVNAYQWRGRVKRKRGTSLLNRLKRYFNSSSTSYTSTSTINLSGGAANILTAFSLQSNGNIVPGSVIIVDTTAGNTYTDSSMDGTLTGAPGGSGTINYATGVIIIAGGGANTINVKFNYYPDLPVMGLREFISSTSEFPDTIGFDTTYSYNITRTSPYNLYDVSFYKNPPVSGSLPGYIPKTTWTNTSWNGQDYQQFWTTNYQGAMWTTNGIEVPFDSTNVGMQYKVISNVAGPSGPPAIVTLTIVGHGLVQGDFIFINEVVGNTGINFQTGYVISANPQAANTVVVELPFATVGGAYTSGGIAQYLTNRSDVTKDCLRFYDGDPTSGNSSIPILSGTNGWVNFMPPISQSSFSIGDLPKAQYYLVGARMILPFKDRILFFGPVVQTSGGTAKYLQDTIVYSQNGTPYYTASFTENTTVTSAATTFNPILVPDNQTATASAYFSDSTGFGGFVTAGTDEPICTVSQNEDVLILGFPTSQVRLVYTGSTFIPFNFFSINSEYGSSSTFSAINMDQGVLTRGDRGFVMTSQVECARFDLEIPDEVFEMNITNNGIQRVTAIRDFVSEWVYFTYPSNEVTYSFPNKTLQYNYRDQSWSTLIENYTTYGLFRKQTGLTWATIGTIFPTWDSWNEPWNSGSSTLLQPQVIAGNQQGFVVFRDDGTNESNSLEINSISYPVSITGATQANPCVLTATSQFAVGQRVTISGVVGMTELNGNTYVISAVTATTVTIQVNSLAFGAYVSGGTATPTEPIYSPNHCLNNGDYIVISGCIGTVASSINGNVFSVQNPTTNGFSLNAGTGMPPSSGTYFGGGVIKRMYVPFIQSKQFPVAWGISRKTRLGPQQYLLTGTPDSQITLLIYLSQDADNDYNIPQENNSLIYSTVLYTCTESSNLGLTPANTNLQMLSYINQQGTNASSPQAQIWHRINTSLIGDTVQVGFTLSDAQMRNSNLKYQFSEIELHSFILDVSPSMVLS